MSLKTKYKYIEAEINPKAVFSCDWHRDIADFLGQLNKGGKPK